MYHLYQQARERFASQIPVEVRILKHLLWVESPRDRAELLDQAFSPGAAAETPGMDMLSTTPTALLNCIDNVLALWQRALKGVDVRDTDPSSLRTQAASMFNPKVITRMQDLATVIRKKYL